MCKGMGCTRLFLEAVGCDVLFRFDNNTFQQSGGVMQHVGKLSFGPRACKTRLMRLEHFSVDGTLIGRVSFARELRAEDLERDRADVRRLERRQKHSK